MARVLVIGAGMGGLAVAARLAVKRHRVTVIEQSSLIGGKLRPFERDGFRFDAGPTRLTLPAVYRDLFNKTGRPLEEVVDLQEVNLDTAYHWSDGSTAVVPGIGSAPTAAALGAALGANTQAEWLALTRQGAQVWQRLRGELLPYPGAEPRPYPSAESKQPPARERGSLRRLGSRSTNDIRLKQLLDLYATQVGSDPRRTPAAFVMAPYVEQTFGIWHIGGGLHRLAQALHQRCLERGVEVRVSQRVEALQIDEPGVTGVELTSGERIGTDIVVAGCDSRMLYNNLVHDDRASAVKAQVSNRALTLGQFRIMAAVTGRGGVSHHNVWFPADLDSELDAIRAGKLPVEPAIYACVPNDKQLAPPGCEAWTIVVNVPAQGQGKGAFDWSQPGQASRYADHVLRLLAARGCDIRDRVRWRQLRTPADFEADTLTPGGSGPGWPRHRALSGFWHPTFLGRPTNATPVPGLYQVGESAHPGSGLPLVGMSAEIVANLIGRA